MGGQAAREAGNGVYRKVGKYTRGKKSEHWRGEEVIDTWGKGYREEIMWVMLQAEVRFYN